jgi:methionyl-tRNA synthetase
MWPAMLLSAGLTPPRQVFGHGFFTVNGQKISKSLGNAIDPVELSDKYSSDVLRFYILADIPFGKDSDFSTERLECLYNSYLANSYGNTVNRVLNMIQRYTGGMVLPVVGSGFSEIKSKLEQLVNRTGEYYDSFRYDDFIRELFSLLADCNKLIDDLKPWELAKRNETSQLKELLFLLFEVIRICTLILHPIMPGKTSEVLSQCGFPGELQGIDFNKATKFGFTDTQRPISTLKHLFPRMEIKGACNMQNDPLAPVVTEQQQTKTPVQDPSDQTGANLLISIDDFKKVELVIGSILTAERIEGADKLLKLTIDIGSEQRTVCAGIAQFYSPEQLPGKKVVLVKNLAPRKLKGIISQGMLLAAKDGETLSLLTLDRDVKAGSPVS